MMNVDHAARQQVMAGMFIDGFARQRVPELLALCEQWKPDVLVRESMEFAAVLVGEVALGIVGLGHAFEQLDVSGEGRGTGT